MSERFPGWRPLVEKHWRHTHSLCRESVTFAMSYDIAVWSIPRIFSRQDAIRTWSDFGEEGPSGPCADSPGIRDFQRELEDKYPQIDSLPEDRIDDSPWSCEFESAGPTLTLSCVWSRAGEISSYVFDLAMKHNLAVFDFTSELIYMPPELVTLSDCSLQSPHLLKTISAYPEIIPDILDVLVGRSDPFLVVERSDHEYIQTLWTEDGLILEYRDGHPESHFRASKHLDQETVARVIQGYVTKGSWQHECAFERVEL